MLDGAATGIALGNDSAARCVDNIFSNGFNDWLSIEVDALYFISVIFGSRIESHRKIQSSM